MREAHVVGAGLAGLSAAMVLAEAGFAVTIHEAAPRAGGRCRSYFDPQLGQEIDNGNHIVFSGNKAVNRYLVRIGTSDKLTGPKHADFEFHDLSSDARWTLKVGDGRFPGWVFDTNRRAPGTTIADHLALARLVVAGRETAIGDIAPTSGPFWERVTEPMLLAVLNCPPAQGSAWLAGRFLMASFARGGAACRPMVAEPTLDAAFVDPALAWLAEHGVTINFGARLRSVRLVKEQIAALDFGTGEVNVSETPVIFAVPPNVVSALVPGITVPDAFCAILNAHFAIEPPRDAPPVTALIHSTAQWVLCHAGRVSVTVSGADDLIDQSREELAARLWADVQATLGINAPLPAWQVVKEKRATFAATPAQDAKRPGAKTRWRNLFLAGDWTQTRLPATIEGAIQSGETAAHLASTLMPR
jgi:hydroxysqualene dehydroxylase